jgi:hypothetical protein
MGSMLRALKALMAVALAAAIGILPSCSTMGGGGGMKYLVAPPTVASSSADA